MIDAQRESHVMGMSNPNVSVTVGTAKQMVVIDLAKREDANDTVAEEISPPEYSQIMDNS